MKAVFGGTFNPPHIGHIQGVKKAALECNIAEVNLMPCKVSPLKAPPGVNDKHRLKMLSLLCNFSSDHEVSLSVDDIELSLPAPSYTVKTLQHLRQNISKESPLYFFLGDDSLYTLPKWFEWQSLLDYCHLIVMPRQNASNHQDPVLKTWLEKHQIVSPEVLHTKPNGYVYRCHSPLITISSSELRESLKSDKDKATDWIPEPVMTYISQHGLYCN